tara:strand:+ start:1113 stop:1859 length:747 start_codon:yes stop_codon:yes gene_type:complete
VWSPSDEGNAGGGTEGEAASTDTSGDEGATQTTETVLGGDVADDKLDDQATTDDDATKDGESDDDKSSDTKDDDKDDESDDDGKGGDVVPEDGVYEFELPEGVELSDDDKTMWSEQFKELELTQAQASKLVALQAERVAQDQKDFTDFIAKQQSDHLEAAKSDKDIGGDKWGESQRVANLGLKALGGDALKNLILTSGNGNNPEIIRELMRVGEMVKDDKFESGSSHEAPVPTEKKWYGDTTPDTKKG